MYFTQVIFCSVCLFALFGQMTASSIPMWEYLTKDEKVSQRAPNCFFFISQTLTPPSHIFADGLLVLNVQESSWRVLWVLRDGELRRWTDTLRPEEVEGHVGDTVGWNGSLPEGSEFNKWVFFLLVSFFVFWREFLIVYARRKLRVRRVVNWFGERVGCEKS